MTLLIGAGVPLACAIIYFARSPLSLGLLAVGLGFLPVVVLAWVSVQQSLAGRLLWTLGIALSLVMAWRGAGARQDLLWLNLVEYLGINLLLAIEFGASLRRGHEPLCTRFARLVGATMSPALVRYTRAVTILWSAFFVFVMLAASLLFALDMPRLWVLFADVATPILIGAMFVGEFAVRCALLAPDEHLDFGSAMRGYRAAMAERHGPMAAVPPLAGEPGGKR
jgi:uncharacterized membrane protein